MPVDIRFLRIGTGGPVAMRADGAEMLLVAIGLWLFAAGLFAPVRRGSRR